MHGTALGTIRGDDRRPRTGQVLGTSCHDNLFMNITYMHHG